MKTAKILKSPIKNLLFVYFAVFNAGFLHGQTKEGSQTFLKKIQKEHDSILAQNSEKKDLEFLTYLPSVSFSDRTGVSVGLSISNFIRFAQDKRRTKIEKKRLEIQLRSSLEKKADDLEKSIQQIDLLSVKIQAELNALSYRHALHLLIYAQFQNEKIELSAWLAELYSYHKIYNSALSQLFYLDRRISEFILKYDFEPFNSNNLKNEIKEFEPQD